MHLRWSCIKLSYYDMLNWIKINQDSSAHKYTLKIPKYSYENIPALEATHKAIQHIQDNYPAPYTLYLSGGVDSQAMLWAWHASGVPYQAVSYVYNYTMNLYDLNAGMPVFAQKLGIKIERRNVDLLNFFDTEYPKYAETYRCGSPHLAAYMYLADQQTDGTVIFSGSITPEANSFYTANEWRLYHYGIVSGQNIVPMFFSETQDLHYAFLKYFESGQHKAVTYQKAGFPVVRQRLGYSSNDQRYSGFEGIRDYYEKHITRKFTLQEKMKRLPGQTSNWKFDLLFRNPWEWRFRQDKYQVEYVESQIEKS